MNLHGGLLALHRPSGWRGALIVGPSGGGKSDLAFRCLDAGFRLVADDRTILWTSDGRLYGRAPDALQDLLEVRGSGVVREQALRLSPVDLIVRCCPPEDIERMPQTETEELLGISIPRLRLAPFEASAPAKLRRALSGLG